MQRWFTYEQAMAAYGNPQPDLDGVYAVLSPVEYDGLPAEDDPEDDDLDDLDDLDDIEELDDLSDLDDSTDYEEMMEDVYQDANGYDLIDEDYIYGGDYADRYGDEPLLDDIDDDLDCID